MGADVARVRLIYRDVQYAVIPKSVTLQTMIGIVRYLRGFFRLGGSVTGRGDGGLGLIDIRNCVKI